MSKEDPKLSESAAKSAVSRPINVLRLSTKGQFIKIEADESERVALAQQMGVVSVEKFNALLTVKRWHKDGVKVSGPVDAELTQNCVFTLAPVPESLSAEINAVFIPDTSKLAKARSTGEDHALLIDPEGDDVPEIFELPELDVGAVAAEFFALEINPYPKAPDADEKVAETVSQEDNAKEVKRENPFAALAALKDKL